MLEFGMPTLIELPGAEDCARLCGELGLQFVELNMNMPHYQVNVINVEELRRTAVRCRKPFRLQSSCIRQH